MNNQGTKEHWGTNDWHAFVSLPLLTGTYQYLSFFLGLNLFLERHSQGSPTQLGDCGWAKRKSGARTPPGFLSGTLGDTCCLPVSTSVGSRDHRHSDTGCRHPKKDLSCCTKHPPHGHYKHVPTQAAVPDSTDAPWPQLRCLEAAFLFSLPSAPSFRTGTNGVRENWINA